MVAAQTLTDIAKGMKKGFFKYVEKTWEIAKVYIDYKYAKKIRHSMMDLVAHMMESCDN